MPPNKRDSKAKFLSTKTMEPSDLLKLRDDKIARLEERIRTLNLTSCMQERLSDWRGRFFTKVVFRLKPSEQPLQGQSTFDVSMAEQIGLVKQMVIKNSRLASLECASDFIGR